MTVPLAAAAHTRPRLGRYEISIALAVFAVAWVACRLYLPAFRDGGGRAMSYYEEFGPAVMSACGRGFVNPSTPFTPALDAFLLQTASSFDCRNLDDRLPVVALDNFQAVTRNLLLSAAAIWRMTGISWIALDNLAATLFSVTLTAVYVVMRLIMGRSLAIFGTLVWGISPMHLGNVAHLRDYSKAPFFALTALAIVLTIRARRPKTLIGIAAIFGVVQGLGLGMRTDVVLNFAPFLLVLFVLGSGKATRNLRSKLAAACLSLSLFVLVAWPVLTTYHRSEGLWHVSLLGLTTPFDNALSLQRAPYDFGYLYDDSYMSTVVQAYWYRLHDGVQVSLHDAGLYETACRNYYSLLVSTFPADFLTRMAGSALQVLNLPFSIAYGVTPLGVTNRVLTWLASVRTSVLLALAGSGPIVAAYLLVLIGMRSRIAACVGFLLLGFWASYPYLQFQGRHVFHLEILTITALLWAVHLTRQTIADAMQTRAWKDEGKRALLAAATVGALAGVVIVSVVSVRVVQGPQVRALFERYANAPEEQTEQNVSKTDATVHMNPQLFDEAEPIARIQQAMVAMDVSGACESVVPVHVRYQGSDPELEFSRDLTVQVSGRTTSSRVFVPVYSIERADGRVSRFTGIDVPASAAACVRLSRVRDVEHSPLMLDVVLSHDWQSEPHYQRLYLGPLLPEHVWVRIARWWPRVAALG